MHVKNLKQSIKIIIGDSLAKNYPIMKDTPRELRTQAFGRMAVSNQHGFIYIRIPKAANSTITKTLAAHFMDIDEDEIRNDKTGDITKKKFQSFFRTKCLTSTEALKRFFIFSFFRNPYARLLSAYLDKIRAGNDKELFHWVAETMGFTRTEDMDFLDFIRFLEQGNLNKNAHWAPQIKLCPLPVNKLHFTGKVENLEHDLPQLIDTLGGKGTFTKIFSHSENRQSADNNISDFYNDNLAKRVYKLYKKDFDALDYSPDLG